MPTRFLLILSIALLMASSSCSGEDKHLPSLNPPEYDPKKVYTTPAAPPASFSQSAMPPAKPASPSAAVPEPCERPPIKPPELEEPPIVCGGGSGGAGRSSSGGGGGGGRNERPADAAARHPSYLLEFRSAIVSTDPNGDPAQSQASAIIRLDAQNQGTSGAEPKYTGQGNISYQTAPLPNWDACTPLVRGQGTVPLRVFQAFIHVEEPSSGTATSRGSPAKIELLYGILGMSQETSTGMHYMLDYKCVPNPPQLYPFWSSMYFSGRGEASTIPEQMFLLKDWTYVGQNGVVATKTLRSTCGGMCDQEVATFTLKEGDGSEASPQK